MTDEDAFLHAISATPEDTTLRLTYADWLEERGDGRAEYLRLLAAFEELKSGDPAASGILASLHQVQLRERIGRSWAVLMCRGLIARLVRGFYEDSSRPGWPGSDQFRQLARRHNALPLYGDLGGMLLLRSGGELLSMAHDDEEPRIETCLGWRLIALTAGADFFPQLRPLLPPRPASAAPCQSCHGTGMAWQCLERDDGKTPCSDCWGLGWLPVRPHSVPECSNCRGQGHRLLHGHDMTCFDCCGWGWVPEDFV
jgi:uncharacterized protein (TIGR02996 family)